jgi:hypothetical protein
MSWSGLRERFTYANVVATVALVLAVTGGATAIALSLPKNSVKSKQIAKEAVKTSDIAKDAVTGDKVKESTLGKVPSAAHADSADSATNATDAVNATNATNATNAGHATNADHAGIADALAGAAGTIQPSSIAQSQNAVTGDFDSQLEVNVKGFGRFWLRCIQNSASNEDDTLSFNLSTTVRAKAIESGILMADEFPLDTPEIFLISDTTTDGASSEYGTQGRRLYVHYALGIIGSTKTLELDGGGFDDDSTPGCAGQLHASVSG